MEFQPVVGPESTQAIRTNSLMPSHFAEVELATALHETIIIESMRGRRARINSLKKPVEKIRIEAFLTIKGFGCCAVKVRLTSKLACRSFFDQIGVTFT